MKAAKIAVIDGNALSLVGLKTLIERIVPQAIVCGFSRFDEFEQSNPEEFFHFFVSSQMLIEHSAFFQERRAKTIVLVSSYGTVPQTSDFHVLNVIQTEEGIVRSVLHLMEHAHSHGRNLPARTEWEEPNGLSPREVEVLTCIAKGMINKEIADRLSISLTTVISHRKNIMDKLNIRSVSGLTIYAVTNGYADISEI